MAQKFLLFLFLFLSLQLASAAWADKNQFRYGMEIELRGESALGRMMRYFDIVVSEPEKEEVLSVLPVSDIDNYLNVETLKTLPKNVQEQLLAGLDNNTKLELKDKTISVPHAQTPAKLETSQGLIVPEHAKNPSPGLALQLKDANRTLLERSLKELKFSSHLDQRTKTLLKLTEIIETSQDPEIRPLAIEAFLKHGGSLSQVKMSPAERRRIKAEAQKCEQEFWALFEANASDHEP